MSLRGITRDVAFLFAGRLASQGLTVLFTVLLVARLGLAGLGEYAFVAAVVALANVATTFGTDMVLIRDISGGGRTDRWIAALVIQAALSLAALGLIWVGAPFIPGQASDVVAALRVYALSLFPMAVFSVATAALRGVGRMGRQASLGAALAFLQLAATWLLLAPGDGLVRAMAILLGVQVAGAAVAWAVGAASIPALRHRASTNRREIAAMARASAPIGSLGLLGVLYQRAGVLALSVVAGPIATGWFAAASRVVEGAKGGHVALFGALYPAMARGGGGTDAAAAPDRAMAWSLRLTLVLAALVSAGLLLTGPWLIARLYGAAFGPATAAVAVLALAVVPSTLATYRSLELVATRREQVTLRGLLISLMVLLALLATLVPAIGWVGACWAMLAAETTQAIWMSARARMPSARVGSRAEGAALVPSLAEGAR